MRTKTSILAAAIIAAGVASSMAQSNVYSVNIVGYVNIPVVAGNFYLIGNPLDTGNGNVITNVFPINDNNFDSTIVYTFDPVTGLTPAETYVADFGWFPGTNVLAPGRGFYLNPSTNATFTFVGNVTLSNTVSLAPGFTLAASAYPAALSLAGLGITNAVDSDIVYRFSPTTGLSDLSTYVDQYGWFETTNGVAVAGGTGGSTNGPTLNVGEAFFYSNANENGQGAEAWTQAFTVN